MRHLKRFERFTINEMQDWATLPVDVHKGMGDVYSKIIKAIGNRMNEIISFFKKATKEQIIKIQDFMLDTFGNLNPEFTEDNAEKLAKSLNLNEEILTNTNESWDSNEPGYKENENLIVKICGTIKQALAINAYMLFGWPLGIIIGGFSKGAFGLSIEDAAFVGQSFMILCLILLFLFIHLMKIFGYGDKYTDWHRIGFYNPKKDIRNKF